MNSIPKGYKKTEVGVIPEKWEVKKLGEACKILRGGSPRPIEDYLTTSPSGVNWIKIGDVSSDSKYITNTEEKIIPEGISYSRSVYPGDFLLSNSMSYGRPYILNIEGCIHDGWLVLQDFCCFFESDFLYYYLSSASVLKQYEMKASGSSVHNLNKDLVADVIVVIPSLCEQQAIAEVLSDMDTLIQAQKELIAKKRDIKQGAMQDLLSGRVRLPGYETKGWKHTDIGDIPDDWEVKELKGVGVFSKGKGISRSEVTEQGNPCLRYGEIYTIYDTVVHALQSFIPDELTSTSRRLSHGDIIFAASGETSDEIAKNVTYVGIEEAYVGGDTIILTPKEQDSIFLSYLLNSHPIAKQKSKIGQGDAVVHIHISKLERVIICVPSLPEQKAIAEVLSDMDDEIENLEVELEKLNYMKRGMMQELLTGRIRLV